MAKQTKGKVTKANPLLKKSGTKASTHVKRKTTDSLGGKSNTGKKAGTGGAAFQRAKEARRIAKLKKKRKNKAMALKAAGMKSQKIKPGK